MRKVGGAEAGADGSPDGITNWSDEPARQSWLLLCRDTSIKGAETKLVVHIFVFTKGL